MTKRSPPHRHCPTCGRAMQPIGVEGVELDWCRSCRALWFDRGELARAMGIAGTPEMTREQPASRCPACRGLLWFSVIDGSEVLACVDCAGCFVTERVLRARGAAPRAGPLEATFVCTQCGDRYALASGHDAPAGLVCSRCAPPPAPPSAPSALDELAELLARVLGLLR